MKQKTIIFDFDGTLVDVEPLFIDIFNTLSLEFGFQPIDPSEVPNLKKFGAKQFIKERVKLPFWRIPRAIKRGKEEYKKSLARVELFPGIKEVIETLKQRGYRVGILSSNSQEVIAALLERFRMQVDFIYESSLFGKARALKKAIRAEGVGIEDVIYLGDEVRDVEACKKCGVHVIAVTWGLNSKEALQKASADETADTPADILTLISTSEKM